MTFINIHTHNHNTSSFSVINIFPEDVDNIVPEKLYSAGIHPWNVTKINIPEQLQIVSETVQKENIIAVGEAGLDKLHPNFDKQKDVFIKQIKIAEANKKPLIIHCVKAFSELLEIFKKEKPAEAIIIHRYSGNITLAEQFIKFGCYLSFGNELFNEKSKTPKVFKKIPLKNIFLETDDADIQISSVYQKAAELKTIPVEFIAAAVSSNFKICFNR